jgi:predicted nucleotidyltransferase
MSKTQFILYQYFTGKPILKAFLFGSYARHEETTESDIDLLVELDYSKRIDLFDFIGWKNDLEHLLGKKVDLVSSDSVSKFIQPHIDKDKVQIYEKQ